MQPHNGANPAHRVNGGRAWKFVGTGKRDEQTSKPQQSVTQAVSAEITGDDTCTALGMTVRAAAPVLTMCRKLLAAGYDPTLRLECYRGHVLALTVASIGQAARLEVNGDGTGFRPYRRPDAAPPVRNSRPVLVQVPLRPAERGGAP